MPQSAAVGNNIILINVKLLTNKKTLKYAQIKGNRGHRTSYVTDYLILTTGSPSNQFYLREIKTLLIGQFVYSFNLIFFYLKKKTQNLSLNIETNTCLSIRMYIHSLKNHYISLLNLNIITCPAHHISGT